MMSPRQRTSLSSACIMASAVLSALPIAIGLALAVCEGEQVPLSADCSSVDAPPSFSVNPPNPAPGPLPPGQPGAVAFCGTCQGGTNVGQTCYGHEDCPLGACQYCLPSGLCWPADPETLPPFPPYVDARCFPIHGSEPDDTCRLKRAAAAAAGKVLWIASGATFEVSPDGEGNETTNYCDTGTESVQGSHVHGVEIKSDTTVTGGGTIKLRVVGTTPPAQCDTNAPHPSEAACQRGYLLKIRGAHDVTISGIRLDGNSYDLNCPNEGFYSGQCEHRHAISIHGISEDITIENCTFERLVGDGVSIGDRIAGVEYPLNRIVVRNNSFSALPEHRNRNGVSVGAVRDLLIDGNHFEQMGRGYFKKDRCNPACYLPGSPPDPCDRDTAPPCSADIPLTIPVSMPGPIDLETESPQPYQHTPDRIERVKILNNTIIGWNTGEGLTGCVNQAGIGVSNQGQSEHFGDVLIQDNTISGCFQNGVVVSGAGTQAQPIVLRHNTIQTTHTDQRITQRWGVGVVGNDRGVFYTPSWVHLLEDNTIMGAGPPSGSDGTSMTGVIVKAANAVVVGNRIQGARKQGVLLEETYEDNTLFTGNNTVFCGNLLCDNGTAPSGNSMRLTLGSGNNVLNNRIVSSPRGISIDNGTLNSFTGNYFGSVNSCRSPWVGCIYCTTPLADCQFVSGNQGTGTMTNCIPCYSGGGGGGDPIGVE